MSSGATVQKHCSDSSGKCSTLILKPYNMKKVFLLFFLAICFFTSPIHAQEKAPVEAEAFYNKAIPQINKNHVTWMKRTAGNVNAKQLNEADVRSLATNYAAPLSLNNMDIEALIILVMMDAGKSASEDLKNLLRDMQETRKKKDQMRSAIQLIKKREADNKQILAHEYDSLTRIKTTVQVKTKPVQVHQQRLDTTRKLRNISKAEIEKLETELSDKLDSISEMGEMESLRMQAYMDRLNKMHQTLSNLMKKISDTSAGIIQNLK